MEKICIKCNTSKDINEFYLSKSSSDGYQNVCKKCMNLNSKKYRKDNAEKLKVYHKKYNAEHNVWVYEKVCLD
jgi:hypothetical protein